ncbi:MAG: hypothetical protein WCK05_14150, partial [Planctomycetota bacterium]
MPKGGIAPLPVRLADGRTFPVTMKDGRPVVDWTGLIRKFEWPGFKPITFEMPFDGYLSLNLIGPDGMVARHLLNWDQRAKGAHTVQWDGLSDAVYRTPGEPLPSGDYTWQAIAHPGAKLTFHGYASSAARVPWNAGPTDFWLGDHGVPTAVVTDGERMILATNGAEGGRHLIATDFDGKLLWSLQNTTGGTDPEVVAVDDASVYVAHPAKSYIAHYSGKSTVLLDAVRVWFRGISAPAAGAESSEDQALRKYRVWRGTAGRLIAGMCYLGQWEERCEAFIQQLAALEGVFCAENLLGFVQAGGGGSGESVASFLLPYLQRGELRMLAEATPEEVEACRRLLPGLLDVFQIVPVPVFSEPEAVEVLRRLTKAYAATARLQVDPMVPALVHRLFRRFEPYAVFPGPAARFLRGLFEDHSSARTVSCPDTLAAFVKLTGLPEILLRDDLPLEDATVRADLSARVIGQPEA